jgi:phosphate transport system substrate-binding protein
MNILKKLAVILICAGMMASCTQTETPTVNVESATTTAATASPDSPDSPDSQPKSETVETTTTATAAPSAEDTTTSAENAADAQALRAYLKDNFPSIDGSTSTLPLDAAIRSAIFGTPVETEKSAVVHSQTYRAFERVAPYDNDFSRENAVDVLLSVKMTDADLDDAKERGADLVITPIAKEGFVFLVNKANPVDSISADDLRKIYSGEITNWKELGGDDAEIKPFQRNADSGSQTAMADFMGEVPLTAAETLLVIRGMGDLVDGIANFDSGQYAIGYNMYSYTTKQYVNSANVKLIAVDGILPTDETLNDGSYPIATYTYTFYDNNRESSREKGGKLTEWLLTADGQKVIADAGYVNLTGEKAERQTNPIYGASGSGMPIPENYQPVHNYYGAQFTDNISGNRSLCAINAADVQILDYDLTENFLYQNNVNGGVTTALAKGIYPEILLTDTAVADIINADLKAMTRRLEDRYDDYYAFLSQNRHYTGNYGFVPTKEEANLVGVPDPFNGRDRCASAVNAVFNIKNGYFSAALSLRCILNEGEGILRNYAFETAVYDLRTGEKLNFSDLFFEGTDFLTDVNATIARTITEPIDAWNTTRSLGAPFVALEDGLFGFTLNSVIISDKSDYVGESYELYIDFPVEIFVPQIPDKMEGLFGDAEAFRRIDPVIDSEITAGIPQMSYQLFSKTTLPEAQRTRLNDFITSFIDDNSAQRIYADMMNNLMDYGSEMGYDPETDDVNCMVYAEYYTGSDVLALSVSLIPFYTNTTVFYDTEDFTPLTLDDLAAPGFESAAQFLNTETYLHVAPSADVTFDQTVVSVYTMTNFTLLGSDGVNYEVTLPDEYALRLPQNRE